MIQTVSVNPPDKIKCYTNVTVSASGSPLNGFPLLSIDRDSYIVQAEIHSALNFRPEAGCHCLAIGKGCSIADGVTFMIDQNHDYRSVFQGNLGFAGEAKRKTPRKGTIIIQNDVWVGSGATIMPGVTLHNGCIVAAKSVVTRDVPPYAIVGGNPAQIIRKRFEEKILNALQQIAWWDWPEAIQKSRRADFALPVEVFVEKYLPPPRTYEEQSSSGKIVLFPVDISEPFPLYPQILQSYLAQDRPNAELLIYLSKEVSTKKNISKVETILSHYKDSDNYVTLQTGVTLDENILFQRADYYITTRAQETVYRTCLADRYEVKVLYGTDNPVFPTDLK